MRKYHFKHNRAQACQFRFRLANFKLADQHASSCICIVVCVHSRVERAKLIPFAACGGRIDLMQRSCLCRRQTTFAAPHQSHSFSPQRLSVELRGRAQLLAKATKTFAKPCKVCRQSETLPHCFRICFLINFNSLSERLLCLCVTDTAAR